jgi:integrase/recombinase XerD
MNTNQQLTIIDSQDQQLINMWIHGRSEHTQKAYRHDVQALLTYTGKSIRETTLEDLQYFADSLTGKDTTKARTLNSVKSLFSFAHTTGYIPFNVGAALRLPKLKNTLAQRIMSEEETVKMISLEDNARNHAILRLLYHCGLRVSEVVALRWSDVIQRGNEAQLTIFGKGGKTRQVLISSSMYDELLALEYNDELHTASPYIFRSRRGGNALDTRQVERIVTTAAKWAGIKGNVSPHWLRHAHASHSLDRGAPINLVRETLGHENLATTGKYTHACPNASSSQFLPL